ncbi:MAG: ribonuclease P protein component [SAR202 cluster bacterium]|nr:ribonuclease P protein component [SAR202 cluster bacterium]
MRKEQRLTRGADFSIVLGRGRRWSDKFLVLVASPNGFEHSRFGFSVSKRVGGAVVRNRVKRRLREVVTHMTTTGGWDVVIIARKGADVVGYAHLRDSTNTLMRRAGIVHNGTNLPKTAEQGHQNV